MSGGSRTIDSLYGQISIPDWPEDLIVRSLKLTGEWCALETQLAALLLRPGEIIWDAGAFLGTFSLGLAQHVIPGGVLAIEINAALSDCLNRNLGLLPCPATTETIGLGSSNGWLIPPESVDESNYGATGYRFLTELPLECHPEALPCRSLADLRSEHGHYDMLKLDLEGMELDALQGDIRQIRTSCPVIWVECNENLASLKLFAALQWLGYQIAYVGYPAFRKENYLSSKELIYPMAYEAALIAAPIDRLEQFYQKMQNLMQNEDIIFRRLEKPFDLRRALYDTPRWSRSEWNRMNRAELIARLGRLLGGDNLQAFLTKG